MKRTAPLAAIVAASLTLAACSGLTPKTVKGSAIGGAVGATAGVLATKTAGGALLGGGLGALAGYHLAKNSYRCQKVDIFGQPYWGWCLRK